VSTDATIVFKEWLPDLPPLDNPGLIEAYNTLPVDKTYKSFAPLAGNVFPSGLLPDIPVSAATFIDNGYYLYAFGQTSGGAGRFWEMSGGWVTRSALVNAANWVNWAQWERFVIAAPEAGALQVATVGATGTPFTALATSGTNPVAGCVAKIGQFIVAGRFVNGTTTTGAYVRWSSIDNPRDWPTPNSATAVARQAGEQFLDLQFGLVNGLVGGDQFGVILQFKGLTRMTYVGGSVVFQFDLYESQRGSAFPQAVLQVGNLIYYAGEQGFFVTDGVSVKDIGDGRLTRRFLSEVDFDYYYNVRVAHDPQQRLIYWSYPDQSATSGRPNKLLIYSYADDRWTRADQECWAAFDGFRAASATNTAVNAFTASFTVGSFSGTPGSAIFTTAETEANPGGYTRISGVKPLVDVTANAVTVAMGTRNNRSDSPTFTSEITANSRSGFCAFRQEGRYHRARTTIAGTFNAAQGIEVDAVFSGQT
jgi:hypothetical protein